MLTSILDRLRGRRRAGVQRGASPGVGAGASAGMRVAWGARTWGGRGGSVAPSWCAGGAVGRRGVRDHPRPLPLVRPRPRPPPGPPRAPPGASLCSAAMERQQGPEITPPSGKREGRLPIRRRASRPAWRRGWCPLGAGASARSAAARSAAAPSNGGVGSEAGDSSALEGVSGAAAGSASGSGGGEGGGIYSSGPRWPARSTAASTSTRLRRPPQGAPMFSWLACAARRRRGRHPAAAAAWGRRSCWGCWGCLG